MAIERKPGQNWIKIRGVEDFFRIALIFNDSVCIIVNQSEDWPDMPAGTKMLTPVDLDGDLLVELEATMIEAFLTDREVEDECEDEAAAA